MSGLGRRTHYRKHLTDKVLHDFPVPSDEERIAKVVATRGGNQFDIILPNEDESSQEPQLAILPTKFRKLVWLKRNDFVIVQTGKAEDDETSPDETGSIRFIINHILYKDQVKHLKTEGYWPVGNTLFNNADTGDEPASQVKASKDGIVYEPDIDYGDEDDEDHDLFVNTNRIQSLAVEDSSSSENEDEDR